MKIKKSCKSCVICKDTSSNELELGGLKVTKNLCAHYYCLLFCETITQSGDDDQGILGFLPSDIASEVCRTQKQVCIYCKGFGATAGCVNKFCNRKFHLPCGIANNTQQNYNNFTSYCHIHRKSSNIPVRLRKSLTDYKCVICLEYFEADIKLRNILWADCCKAEIILHLNCIRRLALSAGYFTKCPGCNNNSEFLTCIKYWGVFVPERDAAWEIGENAFSELYEVHDTCDVSTCLCPQGRDYATSKGKWRLVLCHLCGSYGTHAGCSQFKNKFVCDVCNIGKSSSSGNNTTTLSNGHPAIRAVNGGKGNIENRRYNTRFISTRRSCVENLGRNNFDDKIINIKERYSCDDILLNNEKDPLDLNDELIVISDDDESDSIKSNNISQNDPLEINMIKVENILIDEASTSITPKTLLPNRSERNVALKSTTKLPYTYENGLLCNVIKSEDKNNIVEESDKPKDNNSIIIIEDSKNKDAISVQDQITYEPPENEDGQHNVDQKVAETELILIKECDNNFADNTLQLEKNTINSLDDIIDLDLYPDKEIDSNNSNLKSNPDSINSLKLHSTSTNMENQSLSSNDSKQEQENILNERKVVIKSTTKLSYLKRKADNNLEEVPSKRPYFESYESQFSQNIVPNTNDEVGKVKKYKPILRRSPVRRSEDINDLIINTVIFGDQHRQNTTNLPLNNSVHDVVEFNKDEKQPLSSSDSKENSLHYKVLLDVEREVEFVHSPKCSVSTENNHHCH
ncbi:hypothetical protein ILUMI_04556 [Ignelater luminosus]|uniref:PHD-type domain-containing protein n=1 Tax=Ignelater luminosus TaxID=2038154 RepID=A0A8K0DCM9_IGNLU|nr:hypothetical protein ILUMI_04556 [Ignelater luminosus]